MPVGEAIGMYPVPEAEACYLVEVMIVGSDTEPDFSTFTQPVAGIDRSNWQVACDERLLDASGEHVLADLFMDPPETWPHEARVVFFLHELQPDQPIETEFGSLTLPPPSARPDRLRHIDYEVP